MADGSVPLKASILRHVRDGEGAVTAADLLHLGSRASVDQTLSRMARAGLLRRSRRGHYIAGEAGANTEAASPVSLDQPRREGIIMAAADLFAVRGYFGVSMRDIAASSGLHMATLYHYFADKRSLYDAVLRWAWEEGARHTLRDEEADAPAIAQLRAWIDHSFDFYAARSTSAMIRDRELFLPEAGCESRPADILDASARHSAVVTLLIERIAPPLLTHITAERIGEMIHALVYGMIKFRPAHALIHPAKHDPPLATIKADVLAFVGVAIGVPVSETGD